MSAADTQNPIAQTAFPESTIAPRNMQRLVERYRLQECWMPNPSTSNLGSPANSIEIRASGWRHAKDSALTRIVGRLGLRSSRNGHSHDVPCTPDQIVEALLMERYPIDAWPTPLQDLTRILYYGLRPFLSERLKEGFQRIYFTGWDKIRFPQWPVDFTVDRILEQLLVLVMTEQGLEQIPFIWFWPDGHDCAAIVTHDVEMERGRNFCARLMDIDDCYAIKSSFQVVPETRYEVPTSLLQEMRRRGFEVNIHDLNHDGRLYRNRQCFLERARIINEYGRRFGAAGFRAGVMYRNQEWFNELDFDYDMSVPNVSHLDPQRGGCCTVMPYFVGNLVELPLTTTQDYTLLHILRETSIQLWGRQIQTIRDRHGLISILVHPDYLQDQKAMQLYLELLRTLADLRNRNNAWIPTPGEASSWWRVRAGLTLTRDGSEWKIVGQSKERARLAYAHLDGGKLRLEVSA